VVGVLLEDLAVDVLGGAVLPRVVVLHAQLQRRLDRHLARTLAQALNTPTHRAV
jgi:hypothetical protein